MAEFRTRALRARARKSAETPASVVSSHRLSTRPVPAETPRSTTDFSSVSPTSAGPKTRLEHQAERQTPHVLRSLERDWRERRRARLARLAGTSGEEGKHAGTARTVAPSSQEGSGKTHSRAIHKHVLPIDSLRQATEIGGERVPHQGALDSFEQTPAPSADHRTKHAADVSQWNRLRRLPITPLAPKATAPARLDGMPSSKALSSAACPKPITFGTLPAGVRQLGQAVRLVISHGDGTLSGSATTAYLRLDIARDSYVVDSSGTELQCTRLARGEIVEGRSLQLREYRRWKQADITLWHDISSLVVKVKQRTERVRQLLGKLKSKLIPDPTIRYNTCFHTASSPSWRILHPTSCFVSGHREHPQPQSVGPDRAQLIQRRNLKALTADSSSGV